MAPQRPGYMKLQEIAGRYTVTRRSVLSMFFLGLLSSSAKAVSVTARSGEPHPCLWHYRVDAQGREWPVSIRVTVPPSNGKVTSRIIPRTVRLQNGHERVVHATQVVYQSKNGFVGQDSFTYLRITKDPTDPDNNRDYTISVTVR
jgi:hypothetical protein